MAMKRVVVLCRRSVFQPERTGRRARYGPGGDRKLAARCSGVRPVTGVARLDDDSAALRMGDPGSLLDALQPVVDGDRAPRVGRLVLSGDSSSCRCGQAHG